MENGLVSVEDILRTMWDRYTLQPNAWYCGTTYYEAVPTIQYRPVGMPLLDGLMRRFKCLS